MTPPKSTAWAEINLVLAAAIFAVMAVCIKLVPDSFSGPFISLIRFSIGITLGVSYLKLTRTPFRVQQALFWVLRGFFGSTAMVLYFTAIQLTGSGRATLLLNTFPIFVAIFGYLIFRERISRAQLASIVLCVTGVVFVFYDGSSYSLAGNLIGLASGMGRGISVHFIKRAASRNHPIVVYLSACFWGMLLLPFTASQVRQISWYAAAMLLAVGVLSFVGQILMTRGIRSVNTIKASLLSYTTIPLTILLGLLIGEEFRGKFFVGILCIAGGLLINAGVFERKAVRR